MDAVLQAAADPVDSHFRLHLQQAMLALVTWAAVRGETVGDFLRHHPFAADPLHAMAAQGLEGVSLGEAGDLWRRSITEWEADPTLPHLPLRVLRRSLALDAPALELLMLAGLVEEDARWSEVFARLAGVALRPRPTLATLAQALGAEGDLAPWRRRLTALREAGLVQVPDLEAPAADAVPHVPLALWDALRGLPPAGAGFGFEFVPHAGLPHLRSLVLPPALHAAVQRLLPLLAAGEVDTVVVRGPRSNGRRTLLQAMARELRLNVLQLQAEAPAAGLMATLLNAMPVVALEATPGQGVLLPPLAGWDGPVGVALGTEGALAESHAARAFVLGLPLPGPVERRALWQAEDTEEVPDLRMASGHIRRAATLAATSARLAGHARPQGLHRRQAAAAAAQESLEGLAPHVPPLPEAAEVVLPADTAEEFDALVARCRHREQLGPAVGAALGAQLGLGVRALFRGPSGCGKTLAARRLAALLDRELYRVDLSAVVDKYIGESEKRLARVLDRAEAADAVLLFDEGDALLGKRTAVQSSTDRYANLETNFLLQRLDEGYGGILVVTTNSAEQIDGAFRRRMDAVIDFRLPDALERQALWRLHLPADHGVDEAFLEEAAQRCPFAGGQIRNAVLHAALSALQRGSRLRTEHLEAAIRREYRKSGGTCPLRGGAARG